MAENQPGQRQGCDFDFLGGRRQHGKERKPQHSLRNRRGQGAWSARLGRGRPRRRLHKESRGLRCRHSNRRRKPRHTARGGVSGRRLALSGVASEAAEERYQMVKAVFLDRDGVIDANIVRNGKPVAPTSLAEFTILPGAANAVQRLKDAGFLTIVVTNQPDVRTGLTPKATMEAMNDEIRRQMPIDDFFICFHVDADNCACRKPKPGLILEAAKKYNIDLASSYIVGDRWRDVRAGQAAGCRTIFVDYGFVQDQSATADQTVKSLAEAAEFILKTSHKN